MGLIETLIGHITPKIALALVPGLFLAWLLNTLIIRPAWQEIKLARLPGARAPKMPTKLPFGGQAPSLLRVGVIA